MCSEHGRYIIAGNLNTINPENDGDFTDDRWVVKMKIDKLIEQLDNIPKNICEIFDHDYGSNFI